MSCHVWAYSQCNYFAVSQRQRERTACLGLVIERQNEVGGRVSRMERGERWSNTMRFKRERVTVCLFIFKGIVCLCVSEKRFTWKHKVELYMWRMEGCLVQNLSLLFPELLSISKVLLKLGCKRKLVCFQFPRNDVLACTDSTADLFNVKLLPEAVCFVSRSSSKMPILHRSALSL